MCFSAYVTATTLPTIDFYQLNGVNCRLIGPALVSMVLLMSGSRFVVGGVSSYALVLTYTAIV